MYCEQTDIELEVGADDLAKLVKDSEFGTPNYTIVTNYIEYAEEFINSYLRGRYELPLSTNFKLIKGIAISIVVYRLHRRRNIVNESVLENYNSSLETLKAIVEGKTILSEQDAPEKYLLIAVDDSVYPDGLLDNYSKTEYGKQ